MIKKILLATFIIGVFWILPFKAEAAILKLTPSSQSVFEGESFIVQVKLDTQGEKINAVEGHISFPSDELKIVRIEEGGSILDLWPQPPSYSNQKGEVDFVGGVTKSFRGEGKIVSLMIESWSDLQTPRTTKINFKDDSQVLLSDGQGTPAELKLFGGSYQIEEKPQDFPTLNSGSHSNQYQWYSVSDFHIHWDLIEGAQYSFRLAQSPLIKADTVPDEPEGELKWMGDMAYQDLEDGIYYFSLRQKLPGEEWSNPVTRRVMIDSTPPQNLELEVGQDPSVFGGEHFLSFSATDETSGIDYYEVKEGNMNWEEGSSPYLLKNQELNQVILVRAVDRAGNSVEQRWEPQEVISLPSIAPLSKLEKILGSLLILIIIVIGWWVFRRFQRS